LSLVLDPSDCSLSDPVNVCKDLRHSFVDYDFVGVRHNQSKIGLLELLLGEVGELVDALLVGSAGQAVVGVDLGQILIEDPLSI